MLRDQFELSKLGLVSLEIESPNYKIYIIYI